jgi:SAM-dependent MidA family methyltransferase
MPLFPCTPVDALTELPLPEPPAQAHSERLIVLIRDEIASAGGRISFAHYMERVLFAPGLGYYSAGSRKFGGEGDFVTAPEISPLFSRALARQVAEVLTTLGGGEVLEAGGGTGAMAIDMLLELECQDALPARYLILELSADLRQRQRDAFSARAPHLLQRVRWLDALPGTGFRGVVVANELLDALPVHGFRVEENGVRERFVRWDGSRFQWCTGESGTPRLAARLEALAGTLPIGYKSEINLAAEAWVASVAAMLEAGVVLLIDYGFAQCEYYHPRRSGGTLMCHYRHRAHDDPFVYPGLQDITAHVDFTAIAEVAAEAGLNVDGYNTQGLFLLANDITRLAADATDERERIRLAQQIRTLTLPGDMGERFKVMALSRRYPASLRGFALQDLRCQL